MSCCKGITLDCVPDPSSAPTHLQRYGTVSFWNSTPVFPFHLQYSSSYAGRSDCILTFNTVIRIWLLICRLLTGLQIRQLTLQKPSERQTIHSSLFSAAHRLYADTWFTTSFHISFVWWLLLLSCILMHHSMESVTAFLIFRGLRTSTFEHNCVQFCSIQSQYCQSLKFKHSRGFNDHFPSSICHFPSHP